MTAAPILTVEEDRRRRMLTLYPRAHGPAGPDRYRAIAEWWRLHAEETAIPEECFRYAEGQDRLAADMEARPTHYRAKLAGQTYWQCSELEKEHGS